MKIKPKEIKRQFSSLLEQFGMNTHVELVENKSLESRLSVLRDQKNIILNYNSKLMNYNNTSELEGELRHEICHLLTLPTMEIPSYNIQNDYVHRAFTEYHDLFREFIAEREFIKRFRDDKTYLNFKKKIFTPETVLSGLTSRKDIRNVDLLFAYFITLARKPQFFKTGDEGCPERSGG